MGFQGNERFEITGRLGSGGMGVVYAAFDRARAARVALKTLRDVDPANLYRLKREFRALCDLSHPNIITLYDLVAVDGQWFFTMELIEGDEFLAYVRPPHVLSGAEAMPPGVMVQEHPDSTAWEVNAVQFRARARSEDGSPTPAGSPDARVADLVDMPRLRDALGQLARALHALHGAGMVHRDLKPANVLVDRAGRVVLTDFGVVAQLGRSRVGAAGDPGGERPVVIVGTPAFMAPELLVGEPPSRASDWYAFGVLIYLALTGRLPFAGNRDAVVSAVIAGSYPPVAALVADAPADLSGLCARLLARRTDRRPAGDEVLAALAATALPVAGGSRAGEHEVFVGRTGELAALRAVYDRLRGPGVRVGESAGAGDGDGAARAALALVVGRSGMGKTWLVDRFIDSLVEQGDGAAVVLSARCHPSETVPFKAFDGAIDELSDLLSVIATRGPLPVAADDLRAIARLFPVALQLTDGGVRADPALADMALVGDAAAARVAAVAALRRLLTALAAPPAPPLVLSIDDVQWADADSQTLLRQLLAAPPARVMFVATVRTSHGGHHARVPAWLEEDLAGAAPGVEVRRIQLGPLTEDEQRALLAELSRGDEARAVVSGERTAVAAPRSARADALLAQAEGHPMLLAEITRHLQESDGAARPDDGGAPAGLWERGPNGAARDGLRLADVLTRRVARLAAPARAVVESVAVAGEPLPVHVLTDAAGLSDDDRDRAVAMACASRLVRRSDAASGGHPALGDYHAAVSEAVRACLSESRTRALSRGLARALIARQPATNNALVGRYLLAAGERVEAARHLLAAARRASAALALDHAEALYRDALAALAGAPADREADALRCRAWLGLAEGMRVAGRGDDALAVLARAEDAAERHGLVTERATLHSLRGAILFPRGDLAGCMAEHERARALAIRAGSPELEARALGGIGDALYLAGRMRSARDRFARCVALCREHALTAIEIAHLMMLGGTQHYMFEFADALESCREARALASRHGALRAEMVAGTTTAVLLTDLGDTREARAHLARSRECARLLGARHFELLVMAEDGRARLALGERDEAIAQLADAVVLMRTVAPAFAGPTALGAMALATRDPAVRARCLRRGAELLAEGCVSFNYFMFYRDAIDASLAAGAHDAAIGYADALEAYTRAEPLPYTRFIAARGRALARFAAGVRDPDIAAELRTLRDEARAVGFALLLPELEAAVAAL